MLQFLHNFFLAKPCKKIETMFGQSNWLNSRLLFLGNPLETGILF